MKASHIVTLLALGAASCLLGYALAHIVLAEWLIEVLSSGPSDEWIRDQIGDVTLQLCCGVPFLVPVGFTIAGLGVLADRLVKVPGTIRAVIVSAVGLVAGFFGYIPYQLILLFFAAV